MSARKPTRAAIYCRISSDREGTELGVQRQEQDCRELAAELGWTLYPSRPVFVDNDKGASIRSRKRRRDWDAMFDAVRAGAVDGIIYYSNSRLTRRSREYLDVIDLVADTGVQLASVMSTQVDLTTASGRLIGKILADVDAHDAEVRAELVARRWQQRRETGHPHSTGFRPFGFGWTGTDENGKRKDFDHDKINDVEAQAIRDAARMILDGASLGDVVTAWTGQVLPVNGGRWSRTTVRRALTRPRVAGLIEHKGRIEVNGDGTPLRITDDDGKLCPPILDAETWAQVCDRISDRSSLVRARYRGREHLLSGLLVCGLCGRPMKVSARRAEDGTV
ncbi:MAG: recombinase family protein, partial [Blastococcus sp.]